MDKKDNDMNDMSNVASKKHTQYYKNMFDYAASLIHEIL